jgi:hypothetical protein
MARRLDRLGAARRCDFIVAGRRRQLRRRAVAVRIFA